MVSWYYNYFKEHANTKLPSFNNEEKCKFKVINQINSDDNVATENQVKELCNKVRGGKCSSHNQGRA